MTHPFPLLEPSLTPSRMPKPIVRKTLFYKQKVFVLENTLLSFNKYIGQPSEANWWVIFLKQSWVRLRDEPFGQLSKAILWKIFLEIHFTTIFIFLSCHALTSIYLGFPSAYEMHYAIFIQHMPIYHHAYIEKIHIHTTCYLFMAITSKLAHMG